MTILLPYNECPQSPIRTLKGESIRSLRGLLQRSLSSSSLRSIPTLPSMDDDDNGNNNKNEGPENVKGEDGDETKQQQQSKSVSIDDNNSNSIALKAISGGRPADEVRARFIHNLGIQKQQQPPQQQQQQRQRLDPPSKSSSSHSISNPTATTSTATTFQPWDESYEGQLRQDDNKSISHYPFSSKKSKQCCMLKDNRKLQYNEITTIHPIPSHKVYSNRIKSTIWTGAIELGENVARNSLEFSYENWNFDNVLDEDTGLVFYHGEYIHPCHFEGYDESYYYDKDGTTDDHKESKDDDDNDPIVNDGINSGSTPRLERSPTVMAFTDIGITTSVEEEKNNELSLSLPSSSPPPPAAAEAATSLQSQQRQQQQHEGESKEVDVIIQKQSSSSKTDSSSSQQLLTSDEIWKQTCERLGIQPAEYYHTI